MDSAVAIILAPDDSKGMKSTEPVFLHKICGAALIEWVCGAMDGAGISRHVIAAGQGLDRLKECMRDRTEYVAFEGTVDAGAVLSQAVGRLCASDGIAVLMYGDMPLIDPNTIVRSVRHLRSGGCSAVSVTGSSMAAVNGQPLIICCLIRSFIEILEGSSEVLRELSLSDIFAAFASGGCGTDVIKADDPGELRRVCDRVDLAYAAGIIRKRINESHMRSGVTMLDPDSVYIDRNVEIGSDTVIYPGTILEGRTTIGDGCVIGPNSRLVDARAGNNTVIENSVIFESIVGDDTHVGPFAYIRPGSSIGSKVKIGDFVEVKNSAIGDLTKISHLTYVGDADVGKNVNFGCGVVVVNYDGMKKHRTVVEDDAFIGCNVNLVAPVTVRGNSFIAAGSTITEEVPSNSLAIARSRQVIKEEWVVKKGIQRKKK